MTRIVFVRHAQSAPNRDQPEPDWPLSELGRQQAIALAPLLSELEVKALASSPYRRAIDTLRPFADQTGLDILVDEGLRERHLGGWLPDLAAIEDAVRRMYADPQFALEGGETGAACIARFEAALARVCAAHPGGVVAVASHGGVLGHFQARHHDEPAFDFWRRLRNPHILIFDVDERPLWVGERTLEGA